MKHRYKTFKFVQILHCQLFKTFAPTQARARARAHNKTFTTCIMIEIVKYIIILLPPSPPSKMGYIFYCAYLTLRVIYFTLIAFNRSDSFLKYREFTDYDTYKKSLVIKLL